MSAMEIFTLNAPHASDSNDVSGIDDLRQYHKKFFSVLNFDSELNKNIVSQIEKENLSWTVACDELNCKTTLSVSITSKGAIEGHLRGALEKHKRKVHYICSKANCVHSSFKDANNCFKVMMEKFSEGTQVKRRFFKKNIIPKESVDPLKNKMVFINRRKRVPAPYEKSRRPYNDNNFNSEKVLDFLDYELAKFNKPISIEKK